MARTKLSHKNILSNDTKILYAKKAVIVAAAARQGKKLLIRLQNYSHYRHEEANSQGKAFFLRTDIKKG